MSELQTNPTRTLDVVAAEINAFTAAALGNIIEIGRRMCEAKEMLPHGAFGEWIEKNTGHSQSTANNFMRIFNEYGTAQTSLFGDVANSQTFGNLSYTKALALLSVPAEEREGFAKEHDVASLSTRELKEAIRARDAAVKRAESAEKELGDAADRILGMEAEIKDLKSRPVEVAVQEPDEELIKEKISAAVKELEKKHQAEVKKLASEVGEQTEKAKKLKQALEKVEAKAKAAENEDEKQKLAAEIEHLQKQLAMAGAEITEFKVHFASWQSAYKLMRDALCRVDDENRERLGAAVTAQLAAWSKQEVM